ncbi:hypothetical protein [Nocardia thailandica]|uniref:hypothetical protein n=1 Tax=Nocardia thailandica TaxID=257275 RepID=UPI0003029A76|nr:hypothetical protein [Nocardia thailandica]
MTPAEILELPLEPGNDSGADTIRGYLIALLAEVWKYTEGFSGKRPFGNSDWVWDLYAALGRGGAVPITFDEHGYVDKVDTRECDRLIAAAIRELEPTRPVPPVYDVLVTPMIDHSYPDCWHVRVTDFPGRTLDIADRQFLASITAHYIAIWTGFPEDNITVRLHEVGPETIIRFDEQAKAADA